MADWTQIPDATFDTDRPILGSTHLAIARNFEAMAEGAAGAPKIDPINAMPHQGQAGAVGTYAFAWLDSTSTPPKFGDTVSGGDLRPAGFTWNLGVTRVGNRTEFSISGGHVRGSSGSNASTFSGTWRCMGEAVQRPFDDGNYPHTLWLRIA